MSRPTLVTGAAGFAGSHLLDLLVARGERIVAWYRPGGAEPRVVPGVTWQGVNLLDPMAVRDAIRAMTPLRVYHCAGAAHVGEAWGSITRTLEVNALGTHHIVEALRDSAPDARMLNVSSGLVYAASGEPLAEDHPVRPGSPYALTKLAQELVGNGNGGMPAVYVARPFNHVGPRQNPSFSSAGFARRIAEIEAGHARPEIPVGNLEALRDLTDVRDTVRAYEAILERGVPDRPYNVCSGRVIAVGDLLSAMLRRARVQIHVVTDPARYRPNDLPVVHGDPSRIREELGWIASIPLEQTIDDLLDFWRDHAKAT